MGPVLDSEKKNRVGSYGGEKRRGGGRAGRGMVVSFNKRTR